jgi:hypothetical protein
MHNIMIRVVAAAVVCIGLACGGPSIASAYFSDRGAPTAVEAEVETPPAAIPAGEASAFAAFRKPTTETVPSAIRAFFDSPASARLAEYGVNIGQTRRLAVGEHAFYVTPGTDAICIFGPTGGGCSKDPAAVAKNGFAVSLTAPLPGDWRDVARTGIGEQPKPSMVTYGIAPDGVIGVAAETQSGATVEAPVRGNAYVLVSGEPLKGTAPTLSRARVR